MTQVALPRTLGRLATAGTLIGIMIGSGIFQAPAVVASHVAAPGTFMLVWLVGGLLAMSGAAVFGELSAMFPQTGGRYVYLRESIHPAVAFTYALGNVLFLRPVSLGVRAMLLVGYLGAVVPVIGLHEHLAAAILLVLLALVNVRSTVGSAGLTSGVTVVKVGLLGGLAALLLIAAWPWHMAATTLAPAGGAVLHPWRGFGLAMLTVVYSYSGWGSTTYITGEVRDAERIMPRILIGGVAFVVGLFLLVNVAYLAAIPMDAMASSRAVAATAATAVLGGWGGSLVAVVVVVSVLGSLAGSMLTAPRLSFAVGSDVPRLRWLSAVHPTWNTPHLAVAFGTVLAVGYLWGESFESLVHGYVLGSWPFYVLCAVGYFRLRRIHPEMRRPYRVPGHPVIPAFFLITAAAMLINGLTADWRSAMLGSWVMLAGLPVYWLLRRNDDRR
jgi:APA family basic amino acid/polyamine antiporter